MPNRIFIVGEPGTGKTVSAATFPKPMLICDFDDGVKSLKTTKNRLGQLVVPDWEQITVKTFVPTEYQELNFTTNSKGGVGAPSCTLYANELFHRFNSLLVGIKRGQYKTIIIDSITKMFNCWYSGIMAKNNIPQVRIQDYGTLGMILNAQFLPSIKTLLCDFVILTGHITTEKDDLTGMVEAFPVGPSKPQGKLLAGDFDEVWKQEQIGDSFIWKMKKEGLFNGARSRANIPNGTLAHYINVAHYF